MLTHDTIIAFAVISFFQSAVLNNIGTLWFSVPFMSSLSVSIYICIDSIGFLTISTSFVHYKGVLLLSHLCIHTFKMCGGFDLHSKRFIVQFIIFSTDQVVIARTEPAFCGKLL